MWNFLKLIGYVLRGVFWLALILLLAGVAALYLLERGIPAPMLSRLETAISTDDLHIRIERASFSLKHGLRLFRVKALPKRVAGNALVSADEIAIRIALSPGLPLEKRLRGVTVKGLSMPALPPKDKHDDDTPTPAPTLPALTAIPLTLENANVLGIRADRLTAAVSTTASRLHIADIAIRLPDLSERVPLTAEGIPASAPRDLHAAAEVTLDLATRTVSGFAKGRAFPENILPLFTVLRAHGAVEQIECFSKIARPIDAAYTFDVEIPTTDFAMRLDVDVGPCAYRGVPISHARGTLGIYGTNIYTYVMIDPVEARTTTGAPISGRIAYSEETEGLDVDVTTTMDKAPLFDIINILNHGELDQVRSDGPIPISARGAVALSLTKSTITNALTGTFALPAGSLLNFDVRDMTADFTLAGHSVLIHNAQGKSPSGGRLSGDITFHFPDYAADATVFTTNIRMADIGLDEISSAFNVTNERAGLVSGTLRLDGPAHGRTIAHLNGAGHADIRDGVINRMRLFAGFTDYLSRNIPGISALVDQSTGSLDFTITDSILTTDNLLIEGSIFSIKGWGTYDIANDKLAFTVRANIFRKKTIAGRITHFITLPFTSLLLEFKVFGSLENPDWSYVNIIEKITNAVTP